VLLRLRGQEGQGVFPSDPVRLRWFGKVFQHPASHRPRVDKLDKDDKTFNLPGRLLDACGGKERSRAGGGVGQQAPMLVGRVLRLPLQKPEYVCRPLQVFRTLQRDRSRPAKYEDRATGVASAEAGRRDGAHR